jgi:hypothetical protein
MSKISLLNYQLRNNFHVLYTEWGAFPKKNFQKQIKSQKKHKKTCPIKFGVLHLRRFRHKTVTSVEKAVTLHFAAMQTDSEEIQNCFPKVVARITYFKLLF